MIKTLDYRIVLSNNNVSFCEMVLDILNDGYDLFGNPFINANDYYCQCVVKVDRSSELEKVQQVIKSFVDAEIKENQ